MEEGTRSSSGDYDWSTRVSPAGCNPTRPPTFALSLSVSQPRQQAQPLLPAALVGICPIRLCQLRPSPSHIKLCSTIWRACCPFLRDPERNPRASELPSICQKMQCMDASATHGSTPHLILLYSCRSGKDFASFALHLRTLNSTVSSCMHVTISIIPLSGILIYATKPRKIGKALPGASCPNCPGSAPHLILLRSSALRIMTLDYYRMLVTDRSFYRCLYPPR